MDEPFGSIRTALLGLPLSNVWHGHGSALFLEFGNLTERWRADGTKGHSWGQISVGLEYDWRIEFGRKIACGSGGNRDIWDAHLDPLRGATAVDLSVFGRVAELCLDLSTGHRLLTFSLDESGPEWALTDRRGSEDNWLFFEAGTIRSGNGRVARR